MLLIKIIVSLFPVVIFLCVLVLYDSFKLVRLRTIVQMLLIGSMIALICIVLNRLLMSQFDLTLYTYARYGAPFIEEAAKAAIIVFLLRSARIGFMVDAAILGCAVGTGFAIIENIYYLQSGMQYNLFIWILRGLGTAIMHGATTAIFAALSKFLIDRFTSFNLIHFLPGLILAVVIHSFFNHLPLPAQYVTIIQMVSLPLIFWLVFTSSEKALHHWLELGIDTEVGLLEFLTSGTIEETKVGNYLKSLHDVFPGEIIADMICYLRIYLELSIRAKGILLMQQNGFEITIDANTKENLTELTYLEKSIGKTGKRMLSAVFRADPKELWQLYLLQNKRK